MPDAFEQKLKRTHRLRTGILWLVTGGLAFLFGTGSCAVTFHADEFVDLGALLGSIGFVVGFGLIWAGVTTLRKGVRHGQEIVDAVFADEGGRTVELDESED